MSKTKFSTVYGVRIYPTEYLVNENLTDSDLNYLFDTKSLLYSIIIGMFRFIGSKKRNCNIIKDIKKNNNWLKHNTWTTKQLNEYESIIFKILKNLYAYSDNTALQKAQWYIIMYGLNVKN